MVSKNLLLHCSTDDCAHLVYLDEAVRADQLPTLKCDRQPNQGHFCRDCAHRAGYYFPDDVELLERLLNEAGLYTPPILREADPCPTKIAPINVQITLPGIGTTDSPPSSSWAVTA